MTDFYFDGDLAADTGDGSSGNPWKNLSHLRAQTGDDHFFYLVGDFRGQTPGTNGYIEIGGNNWTITGTLRNDLKPKIGSLIQSPVNISSVSISSTTVTLDTDSAHGLAVGDTVTVAGITGAATAANGQWLVVTQPSSTRITYTLGTASSGTSTNGTVTREAVSKAAVYNSAKTGLSVSSLYMTRCKFGIRNAGTSTDNETITSCDGDYFGQYFFSASGASANMACYDCTASAIREDCFNYSGTANTNFTVARCSATYIGYNFDKATPTLDLGTGPGDFVTCHAGSGASNWGTVYDCYASYGTQGFFNNVNTAGTNTAYRNFVSEFAGSGFQQSGGGSMTCYDNVYIAPVNQALDNTTSRGMFKFNPGSGVGGTFTCYQNTGYTAKGSIASFTTAAAMFVILGGIINGSADQFIFKNNRWISNGTAPFAQVINQNSVSITNLVCAAGVATVTATGHGLTAGCRARIIGVTGGAAAVNNTTQTVTQVVDADHYKFATAVTGTSTNGSSQRVPMLVSDYNVYSGDGTASLISYGATSASYTKTLWQQNGYDTNSIWNGTINTTPPTVVRDLTPISTSLGLASGVDLSGTGISGLALDYYNRKRTYPSTIGAFQFSPGGGAFGSFGGFIGCPGYFTF